MRQRPTPGAGHLLTGAGAAIMLEKHGVFLAGLKRRGDHFPIEIGAVLGLDRAELGLLMTRKIRIIRMPRLHRIFVDPRQPLSGRVRKIELRRLRRVGARDDHPRRRAVHRAIVPPARFGQPRDDVRMRDIDRIEMLFEHPVLVADEIESPLALINAGERLDDPVTAGERSPLALGEAVEMAIAGPLRAPDQAAILHRVHVRKVEPAPRARSFGEQDGRFARRGIDLEHVERLLVAALALHQQGRSVLRPVNPRQIDVGIAAEIDLHLGRSIRLHHV